MHVLEIRAGLLESGNERRLFSSLGRCEAGQHLVAHHKHPGQAFVAMHIQESRHAGLLHALAHQQHFRAARGVGAHPFAIEIGAGRIAAQIAAHAAVRIHVGYQAERRQLPRPARYRIAGIQQSFDQPFDKPLRHRFTRMLAGDDPHRRR